LYYTVILLYTCGREVNNATYRVGTNTQLQLFKFRSNTHIHPSTHTHIIYQCRHCFFLLFDRHLFALDRSSDPNHGRPPRTVRIPINVSSCPIGWHICGNSPSEQSSVFIICMVIVIAGCQSILLFLYSTLFSIVCN